MLEMFYQTMMKRSSLYIGFILVGSYFAEKGLSSMFDSAWEARNEGKLFHQLTLPEGGDDDDDEQGHPSCGLLRLIVRTVMLCYERCQRCETDSGPSALPSDGWQVGHSFRVVRHGQYNLKLYAKETNIRTPFVLQSL
eukprot:TRINITY_DN2547_c1_g1_i3.p3 TRINITY_DN2547_c1_g1~~TRINITY_DN2547_c1_g1_i3.p3  ORF type:complete len:138 (-),score=9.14 TRINITY_DN2547_c1_g1_i3:165-578(-)